MPAAWIIYVAVAALLLSIAAIVYPASSQDRGGA
jgi:hypothetical protein